MLRRLCFALALCSLLIPFGVSAQTVPAPATIKLGVITVEAAAEAFYAVDMGFFKKQGLDVDLQIMQNGAAIAAAVTGGTLDAGFADTVSISNAHARGLPLIYLAPAMLNSYAAPTLAILVNGAGPIREPKDLNGKTIAVNGINNITMLPVEAWIDKNGGDSKTVEVGRVPDLSGERCGFGRQGRRGRDRRALHHLRYRQGSARAVHGQERDRAAVRALRASSRLRTGR